MSDTLLDNLRALGEALQSEETEYAKVGAHHMHVARLESVPEIAKVFHAAGYRLEMLTCIDLREPESLFRLVYQYCRPEIPERHRVHADVPTGASAPTLALIYESANWYEREVYDMYGVTFDGHPYLVRILTEEGADYHPLLKDFGVATPAGKEGGDA